MAGTTATPAQQRAKDQTQTLGEITDRHADDLAKARDKNAKAMTKADVRDRLLLQLADAWIDHPSVDAGDAARLSELRGELSEDMGISGLPESGQVVQHPEVRAAERAANVEQAVAAAVAQGLVPEDHRPGDEKPVAKLVEEAHPTSDAPIPAAVPAGAPAATLKPDRPMDPTAKK